MRATTRARTAGRRELAILFQSVSALVSAGVPLERAVAASANVTRGTLRECLGQVQKDLREGLTLASALDRTRGIVPGVVIGMVRAGERGSQLASALRQVAAQLEDEADLVARVRNALACPAILSVAGLISVGVITTVVTTSVWPRFSPSWATTFPPRPRACSSSVSGFLRRFGFWLALIALVQRFLSLRLGSRRPAGRAWLAESTPTVSRCWDRSGAPSPQPGSAGHWERCSGSGTPLLPALDAAGGAAGDSAVRARLSMLRGNGSPGENRSRSRSAREFRL